MDKALVAQRVATRLYATEDAVDAALMEATKLMAGFLDARAEIGFAATLGTEAVNKIAATIAALTAAREACVAAHGELNEVKLRLGVRTRMEGTGPKGFAGEANVVEHRRLAS